MSKTLKTVIDKYVESQDKIMFKDDAAPKDKDDYMNAVKEKLAEKIYNEVCSEVRDKALNDASKMIEEKAGLKRIEEFKKLAINGIIVSFFIGLLVNQSTDIIGYYKGSFNGSIRVTVIMAMIFFVICVIIFICIFISELLKMLRKDKK